MQSTTKWNMFLTEYKKLFYFWLFSMILYTLFRIFLMIYFQQKISANSNIQDYINALAIGMKFDTHIISIFLLIPFLANLILYTQNREKIVKKIRLFFSYAFITISLLLFVVSITYIKEYNNQFNYFIFEILYDDIGAVANTILFQYNPILSLIIFIALLTFLFKILNIINQGKDKNNILDTQNNYLRVFILVILVSAFVFALRGKIDGKVAIRKWAYVTQDDFLNKIVMNPTRTLIYAYKDFKKLQNNKTNPYFNKKNDLIAVGNQLYNKKFMKGDLSDILLKSTQGRIISTPNHVILVVMESYDSWPLQEKYNDLHISDQLRKIAKKGIHFKNFLPSAHSTMNSLGSIITGLPYCGVNISLLKSTGNPEPTSIFKQMEKLGYDSYFFYGGFLSWQNIGNFMKAQGANHIVSAAHAGGRSTSGIWGIDDDQLFSLVQKKLKNKKRTFSIIMTTSYHGPFTIDVLAKGYPYKTEKDYPLKYQILSDGSISPNTLGHLWFSDMAIGNFVKTFEGKEPSTLFVFTGDHYGRRYFNDKANLYELSSVPFILYSRLIEKELFDEKKVGNHLDIFPTIFEMIAPKGTKYKSFGKAMIFKEDKHITFGYKKALTKDAVYKIEKNKGISIWKNHKFTFINKEKIIQNKYLQEMEKKYQKTMGFSWDITINNYQLTPKTKN